MRWDIIRFLNLIHMFVYTSLPVADKQTDSYDYSFAKFGLPLMLDFHVSLVFLVSSSVDVVGDSSD